MPRRRLTLHSACKQGHLYRVKTLLKDSSLEVNKQDSYYQRYPIYLAAEQGHLNIVKELISYKAKTSDKTNPRGNLLYWICQCNDQSKRNALFDYLVNEDIKFQDGTTPSHIAAAHSFDPSSAENLASIVNEDGVTPLYYALFNFELLDLPYAATIESFIKMPKDPLRREAYLWHLESSIQECGKWTSCEQRIRWYRIALPALNTFIKKCPPEVYAEYQPFLSNSYELWVKAHLTLSSQSSNFQNAFEPLSAAMTIMVELEEQDYPWIGQHRDECQRKIAQLYLSSGELHEYNTNFDHALQSYSAAIYNFNQIVTKTDQDKNFIDRCYRNNFTVYVKLGNSYFSVASTDAHSYFVEAIKYHDLIQQKNDDDLIVVCGSLNPSFSPFERLAELDLMSPSTQEKAKSHYRTAIEKLYAIHVKKAEDYAALARYYQHLSNPRLSCNLEWFFMHFATLSLSRDIIIFPQNPYYTVPAFFTSLYNVLINPTYWGEAKILIPSMIQLMQLLLQEHSKAGFPNNALSRNLAGPTNYQIHFTHLLDELHRYYHAQTEKENVEKNRISILEEQVNSLQNQLTEAEENIRQLKKDISELNHAEQISEIAQELAQNKRHKADEKPQTDETPKANHAPNLGPGSPLRTASPFKFPKTILAQVNSPPTNQV